MNLVFLPRNSRDFLEFTCYNHGHGRERKKDKQEGWLQEHREIRPEASFGDLSDTGVCIRTNKVFKPGTRLHMEFELDEKSRRLG